MVGMRQVSLVCSILFCIAQADVSLDVFGSSKDLSVRDTTSSDAIQADQCPVTFHCDARQGSATKRDYSPWYIQANATEKRSLVKRILNDVPLNQVRTYTEQQLASNPLVDIVPEDDNNDYTGFRLERFSNYISGNRGKLVIGVNPRFLEGCSMLAIVSRRAVWMGHIWQNLGFGDPPDEGQPDPVRNDLLTFNVLNAISNVQPRRGFQGDVFDPQYFNAADDNTRVYMMTPRDPGRISRTNPTSTLYFANAVQAIGNRIKQVLGVNNVKDFIVVPYASMAKKTYPEDEPWRAVAFFEYDPDANGKGDGEWRLFYEHTVTYGRRDAQQNVVGKNTPT